MMSPRITIADGVIEGRGSEGVTSFKGIPYAAPPVGDMRWRPPLPVTPWTGVRDATAFGSDCMQVIGPEPIQTTPSEDCLYVNVWTPDGTAPDAGLPVMVWIHGGGYVGGGSSIPYYDGSAFARRGMVVASFNYRLGRFGFFAHPAVVAAADGPVGNYGYLDQIAALEWVRDNIAAFGGDPGNVTIVGESAGGASVLHLIVSSYVKGLFSRAVSLSGGGREAILARPLHDSSLLGIAASTVDASFALGHGVHGDGPDALAKLRALAPEQLVGIEDLERLAKMKLLGIPLTGVPVVDGSVVVGQPGDHFLAGDFARVPVIIGSTAVDMPCTFPPSKLDPLDFFGPDEDAAREAYRLPSGRFLAPDSIVKVLLSMGADLAMHEPAHFVASTVRVAGQPAWVYRFTYTAESTRPDAKGQVHSGELPFMFDTLPSRYGDAVTAKDAATATAFHTYIANFVTTGDPNGDGLVPWPQVEPDAYDVLDFTLDGGPVFGPDPRPSVALVARAQRRHEAQAVVTPSLSAVPG